MNVSALEEPRLDDRRAVPRRQLDGALRLAAHVVGAPCELGRLCGDGRVSIARTGELTRSSDWDWLLSGEDPGPEGTVALRDRDGHVIGGVRSEDGGPGVGLLDVVAPHLAAVLAGVLADEERVAAHGALTELASQLHADEINAEEILRLIVDRARRLIGVDVTWLGLIDDRSRVVIEVASGAQSSQFVDMWIDVGHGVGGLAVKERRTVVVPDHRLFQQHSTDLVIDTLGAEGIVSILCAPLLFEGSAIGALYGGSRTRTSFSDTTVSVFTALAGQAAVSIVNSRLYSALSRKNELLERTLSLHRQLTDAALAGADTHGISRELARLIERPVLVVRDIGKHRAWRYDPGAEGGPACVDVARDGERGPGSDQVEIRAGDERLGTIAVLGGGPLTDFERSALEQGATIMALGIVKERAAWEAEWRLRGELLEEILSERGDPSEGLQLRAARFGVSLEARWTLAVLEPRPGVSADLLPIVRTAIGARGGDGHVLMAKRGDRVLIAVDEAAGAPAEAIGTVLTKAARAGAPAVAGLSTPHRELRVALGEAEAVLRLAREKDCPGLVTFDALGPLRHFLNAPGTDEMAAMVRDVLGVLADYDARRNGELLGTLRAYLRSGGHHPTTAGECHIHNSTLKYRIGRIGELLGRPVTDPQVQFELGLAFATLDVLGSLGVARGEVFTAPQPPLG